MKIKFILIQMNNNVRKCLQTIKKIKAQKTKLKFKSILLCQFGLLICVTGYFYLLGSYADNVRQPIFRRKDKK